MNVKSVQSPSFKAYIPVVYYAKVQDSEEYERITNPEYMKKCQSFVVRNLNGTAKNMANDSFVKGYSKYDSDYRAVPHVSTYYDNDNARVLMVTGRDTDAVTQMAKPIGLAKGEAKDKTGVARSFESQIATRDYFHQLKAFLSSSCKQVQTPDGDKLALKVYFDPKYKKDGTIAKFNYVKAAFAKCK